MELQVGDRLRGNDASKHPNELVIRRVEPYSVTVQELREEGLVCRSFSIQRQQIRDDSKPRKSGFVWLGPEPVELPRAARPPRP